MQSFVGMPHSDPDSLTASCPDADEAFQSMTEELIRAEADVAAHSEVLLHFATDAATKAALEQAEYRDAVARASSAAEERYQVEMRRERDAHRHALAK